VDWAPFAHPDDLPLVQARWREAIATGEPYEIRYRLRHAPDDTYRWVIARARAVRDGAGAVSRWFGTCTDIDDLIRAEGAVEAAGRRTSEILESITDGFFALDLDWRFTYVNAQAGRLLERDPADLLGKNVWDEFPGALDSPYGEHYQRAVATGEAVTFDATYAPLRLRTAVRAFPFAGGLSVYFRDVTAERRAEADLRASEERLRLVVEASNDVIWDWDVRTGAVGLGTAFGELTGWADVARHHLTIDWMMAQIHPDDRMRVAASLDAAVAGGELNWQEEHRFRRADGSYADVLNRAAVVVNDAGEPVRVVGAVLDFSERKAAERALVEAKEQAEAMVRIKSSFLSNMSHEIRTPLTAILGFAEMLAEEVEGEHRELAESINRGGQRLLGTLNNVLDLAQLEGQSIHLRPVPLVVEDEVRAALALLRPLADEKGLALRLDGASRTEATLDRAALDRVLTNLVSNAIKFTDAGHVAVSVEADPRAVTIRVADTGLGMAPEFLQHVFEEFRQESEGFGRIREGSGLGLAIVRRLVMLHGGRIGVESEPGVGSTFSVRLPRV
jgi:PAS domain S-box-containing protein